MVDIRAQLLAAFDVEHREHLQAIRRALAAPEEADLREMFRRAHSLKGAARAVDLPQIEEIAHRLEDLFAAVGEGRSALDRPAVQDIHLALDAIEAEAETVRRGQAPRSPDDHEETEAAPVSPARLSRTDPEPERGLEVVRIEADALRALSQAAHQLANDVRNEQGAHAELRRLHLQTRRLEQLWGELRPGAGAGRHGARARDFEGILRTLGRELGQLAQRQRRTSWSLETDLAVLRDHLDRIAMTPADAVLGDLGRMVRDLAREAGVEIDVRMEGLEVRAERRVLQVLRDPLIHVLRNALSHGAEPLEARRAAGKPDALLVGLEISARGGRLQARVYDDGPGPDLDRLERAALDKGLLTPRGPGDPPPSPEEVLALAFEPGVSSAKAVDRLAGRGMGLSVVLQAARELGGSARLARRLPHGAEVIVSAPLSTAAQAVVVVEAGGAAYGVPSFGVVRLLRLPHDTLESVEGALTVRIEVAGRDVLAPVVSMAAVLGKAGAEIPAAGGVVSALLLARGERHVAFAVDTFVDVREIGVEAMRADGLDPALVLGAGLLDDETPLAVVNPDELVDRWLRDERRLAAVGLGLATPESSDRPQQRTILVVDDSITTRTLEKSILEGQGYRVLLAVDGLDALHILRSGEAVIDLVVADIEMPRMDGFSLLQAIKADASLADLPVILMTSRNDPTDVRRGMDLGAEAYITKQKFDQRELLATIGRVL
ncbi:response regulator [Phenylobacterium sp.]|uniref:hybrid sensor histidine kinase/response regulator n=1 Tax=Phenylobacterium sp. TaxID=1871053 RepID=UPI0028120A76|nr:response regulator [Phenylobacterium sp.]